MWLVGWIRTGPHLAHTTSFNTDGINWNQYSYQNVPCNGWSGVYAILYPDADACPTASMVTSGSLTISDFTGITGEYVYAVNTNPTCPSSSNGSINIELHENWNGISLVKDFGSYTINNVTHNIPVATSYLITGLSSGSYSISINGHSFNTNLVSSHINPSPSITNGYNGFDCSAQLSTGAFATYFWYDLSGTITGNSQSFTAPSSSVYTVEVTDQYGCSGSATQIVNLNISSTISGIHSTCGSTYSVPLIGNNALYNWTVPSGANYTPNSSGNIITVNWGSALNIGGTLSCSVSNACGLSSSSSIQVSPYIATTTATQSCIGINNGSAGVISAGGTPPYSYHWNSGTNTTAALMSNLAAGTYTVTVTDANSCTATASATVSYLPTNIPTPVISGAQSASPGAHTYTITNYNSSYNNYYSWNAIANSGSATISYPNGNKQTASISWPASGGHVDVSFGITGCLQTKTYYVQPYCTGTYTYNDASQSDVTSASIITRSNMLFNGVLTITNDFSFTNCGQVSFGSGAKIIVASGKSLTIDNCTFSPGTCCRMWQGIELEPGAKIFVKNGSYISQAEYGIKVNNGSVFEIYDSHFRDNYVSLQIGTGVSTTITGSVLKNTDFYSDPYTCSGTTYNNFLPKYEGQLTTPAQLPLAGIVANNMTFFKFGNTPIAGGDVRFNNLLNGVISSNSVFHIQNTTFKNMIGGCGISAKTGTIKLRGMGNNFANSENVFENCRYGVFAQDCNLDISLVKSTNDVITGIYFSDCQTVTIKDNSISARINGIHSYHNPNSNVNIENNNIHMSGIPSGNACIRLDEFNIGHPLNVSNNDLYMNLCKYGILTYSMHKAVIKENYIQMNNVFNSSGISCYFSQGNTFQCNTIDALQHYNSAQAGITLSLSPENRVTCNWMNNQYNGIRINGACNPVVLEGNIFNNHNFGLSLAYNGLMGNQVNNGNQWNGTYTSYGAYLSGINTNSALANQIFYYDPSGANIPPTTNNDIMNLGWFAGNLNAKEFDCSNYDCQPFIPLGDDSRSEDEIIANNDDLGSEYVDPSNYFADRFLFERLLKNPELMQNNVILQAFYDQKIYGTIGQFSEMNQEIQDAVKWETVYQMVYATNENLIINAADSLSILDSLLANGYTGGSKADNLNSKMATLAASNDALKATIEQIQDYRLSNSIDDNADIVVSDSYEENEAAVNNIYMTVLESGEYSLSQQQAASLQLISEQCPFSGGPSVYMARSLYHMADAQADWDDDAICIYNGIPPRLRKPENLYNIYPNPTTGVITLNYMMLPEETGLLEIYNSLGVLLSITKLNPENHQVEVDLSYLSPALYHYKIIQNNEPIKKGMISIIR